MKKCMATLLAISMCATIFCLPSNAVVPENGASASTGTDDELKNNLGYSDYCSGYKSTANATQNIIAHVNKTVATEPITVKIDVPADGMYTVGMSYKAVGIETGNLEVGLKINGESPYSEAQKLSFPRIWCDSGEKRIDGSGNEFTAKQIPYESYRLNTAIDVTKRTADPYLVFLRSGVNEITILPVTGEFELEYIEFGVLEKLVQYEAPGDKKKIYVGESVVIEGEKPLLKSSYWLSAKADNSGTGPTPNDPAKSLVNYIGGSNWKTAGDTIVWETPEMDEGYYSLGFSFRQNTVLGGKVYRKLTVDGKTPFSQAEDIGFTYDDGWQTDFFSDDDGEPYLIYLSAGKHEIALTAVPGDISQVCDRLREALSEISSLYIDMTMIIGETVDIYRDYDLFSQISDMKERLQSVTNQLNEANEILQEITGQTSGANSSVIKNMARVTQQMLDNRYTAHRYKSEFYNRYTATAAVLYDMQNMPLDIDKIVLCSPKLKEPFETAGFFQRISFSVQKFMNSFVQEYNNISGKSDSDRMVTIWVNWGRDQAQVLNSLVQSSFTPETGISANIQLVNASMVQAILSGKGPDCILQHSRSEPVNLAMRGVLYDLTKFDDLDSVLNRFQTNADIPYRYKNGLYALPDTQIFYLMFYRKDILKQLNLSVPETWDDFKETVKLLARRNLTVWMPNNPATDVSQVSAGIGSINLFPSLLMQRGLEIYSSDGKSTNLSGPDVMSVFGDWTDYYRKLKLPRTMDFYNRFRTGTCPIGISSYTLYTTLKAAAPEIDGLWGVSQIPGTVSGDGNINHISSGGGTACAILRNATNPNDAWEFLKWWTDAGTQLAYSNETESILGPAGRVAVSNVEAFGNMEWDSEMYDKILTAWSGVNEIPEYPGSYYVSRSVYQSFWNVVESNRNPKDMLLKYGKQADMEIARKWKQYENRNSQ